MEMHDGGGGREGAGVWYSLGEEGRREDRGREERRGGKELGKESGERKGGEEGRREEERRGGKELSRERGERKGGEEERMSSAVFNYSLIAVVQDVSSGWT